MYDDKLSRIAVRVALSRLGTQVSRQDYDDLLQEADIAIWSTRERGSKYSLTSGINAAIKFFFRYVLGWHRCDKKAQPTPQSGAVELVPDINQGVITPPSDRDGPSPEIVEELRSILIQSRNKRGDRGAAATDRDVKIIQMACSGYSNEGIAQELGLSTDSVRKYRSEIVRRLSQK